MCIIVVKHPLVYNCRSGSSDEMMLQLEHSEAFEAYSRGTMCIIYIYNICININSILCDYVINNNLM